MGGIDVRNSIDHGIELTPAISLDMERMHTAHEGHFFPSQRRAISMALRIGAGDLQQHPVPSCQISG